MLIAGFGRLTRVVPVLISTYAVNTRGTNTKQCYADFAIATAVTFKVVL